MKIELGVLSDGNVMMVCDQPLPGTVKHLEYFKSQRLLMVVYNDSELDSELMHYEIPKEMSYEVDKAESIFLYSLFPDKEPSGYKVPMISVSDQAISA